MQSTVYAPVDGKIAQKLLNIGDKVDSKREYDPDLIWFADDIFALSRKWTSDFADAVERLDARVPFKCNLAATR